MGHRVGSKPRDNINSILNMTANANIILTENMKSFTILFCLISVFSSLAISKGVDTISANRTIKDGETIVSAGGYFELGFFKPSNASENRYLGIWYKKISSGNEAVVWVANRVTPLTDTLGILKVNGEGILQLINSSNSIIWSTNSSTSAKRPVAQLLDTGNLVIKDEKASPGTFIWQSFDYPGDTILPGVKFGTDFVTGIQRSMLSWKSVDDPSPGEYTVFYDLNGYPQIFQKKGSVMQYRIGGWNGLRYTGMASLKSNPIYTFENVFTPTEIYYKWDLINISVISESRLTPSGELKRLNWNDRTHNWFMYSTPMQDNCAIYALCGPYGSCNIENSPACGCMEGFEPTNQEEWARAYWTSGCKRKVALDCENGEGFRKYVRVKLPDTQQSWYNWSMSLAGCKTMCKNNCSCTAYSSLDISGSGSGCLLWFGDLMDIREFPQGGQDIYIRMAASQLVKDHRGFNSKSRTIIIITMSVLLLLTIVVCLWLRRVFKTRKLKKIGNIGGDVKEEYSDESQNKSMELPLLSLSTLLKATDNFSIDNKLGEGGFGPVYKGNLLTGQEIAVKRLSNNSWQGLEQFKNEILLISQLQHRNLVKIIGCCLEGEERMLAYEYLPNKSLDNFIFDNEKRVLLTWQHREAIAIGIAKGLLYLHYDSRLRIIHRDLKASNVLLDSELNPKISDFGIARIFGGDQSEGRTRRIIGTYGYMSPEYAVRGKFSVKSDVFSFGVLLIEIVSGEKNSKYRHPDHHHSLLGHAWLLWKKGKAMELVDTCLGNSSLESHVLRFIQVGLLCIQKFPKDRPTMSSVVFMLNNEGAILPQPKEPGFYMETNSNEADVSFDEGSSLSKCGLTITMLEPR